MGSLKPFLCIFGGKFRAAPKYPVPVHGRIVEPFAGGAGYATRHHALDVTLYEIDPVLFGVWDYLIHVTRAEVLALPLLAAGQDVQTLTHIPQEARSLIGFWLNKGMTHPCRTLSTAAAWMTENGHGTVYWDHAVRERIAAQVEHIRHWKVVNASYADAPDVTATWYVDPPYQKRGVRYRFGSKLLDYPALGRWCQARKGQVIVCEQVGADWLPFVTFGAHKSMAGAKREGSSEEAVYIQ